MNSYLIYLAEVSGVFALLYLLFYGLCRRLTFHAINRGLLLLILPLSFAIPVIDIGWPALVSNDLGVPTLEAVMAIPQATEAVVASSTHGSTEFFDYIGILYGIGLLIVFLKLLLNVGQLFYLKRKATVTAKEGFYFATVNVPTIFSCFHWIFIPLDNNYERAIIDHEKAHARLWHTLDLLAIEITIVLLWFNPFVYFFRKSLQSIHEFQADESVLNAGVKKSDYLQLMLHKLEAKSHRFNLSSHFNQLTLKNRVNMITNTKSSKMNIIKYLLFIPVLALLSMTFSLSEGTPPNICPIQDGACLDITAGYGKVHLHPIFKKKRVHGGIDIRAKIGVDVMATGNGTIKQASYEGSWGNLIVIDHGGGYESWYAHLNDMNVEKGQQVKQGHTIGHVGTTGASTGPHLHYEVRLNQERVDPMDYIKM